MAEHSELPWKRAPDHRFVVVDKNDDHVCSCEMEDDVDTIILAANQFPALSKALDLIEYVSRKDSLTEQERLQSVRTVVTSALAALKEASNDV